MKRFVFPVLALMLIFILCSCSSVDSTVSSLEDIEGKTVGIVKGTLSEQFTEELEADITVKKYASSDSASADLKNGTIDCIIIDENMVSSIVKAFSGLKSLSDPIGQAKLSFMCARARGDLASALSDKIESLSVISEITESFSSGKEYIYEQSEEKYETVFTVGVCISDAPYAYVSSDKVLTGFEVEIAKAVCDSMGVGINFQTVSRDEIQGLISTGKIDFALGGLFHSSDKSDFAAYSASYYSVDQIVITRK